MAARKTIVVALGGNAIIEEGTEGTIEQQFENTRKSMKAIVGMIAEGHKIVLTHGNGPQVGNILMRNDAGEQLYGIPQMPLDICVADSQGGIGYMIERMLRNVLRKHGIDREVCCLVTPVIVDRNDPAFTNPTKRVGRIYDKAQADALAAEKGWIFKEEVKDTGRGWRRVVPSPNPKGILNIKVIDQLVRQGIIVIASGGGGVPVYIDEEKTSGPPKL